MVILVLFLFFLMGRSITTFAFKKFVINKAFVSLLPKEYTLEEAEAIRREVYDFYDRAGSEGVSDLDLLRVSGEIQKIMRDDRITPEEVNELLGMIREIKNRGPRPERSESFGGPSEMVGGRVSEKETRP